MNSLYDAGSDDSLVKVFNIVPLEHGFLKIKLVLVHKRVRISFAGETEKYYTIKKEVFDSWRLIA